MNKDDIIKAEIIRNAANLFKKWGYTKTTIEDIARASGKGKSSLYYYYKDKEEIFVEVVTEEINSILSLINEKMKLYTTAGEKLHIFIETHIIEFEKYRNLYNIISGEIVGNIALFKRLAEKFEMLQVNIIKGIIEFGLKNKEFYIPRGKDVSMISYIIINTLASGQMRKILFENKNEVDMGEAMSWLFIEGLTRK